jgi:hypothetical protein
LDDVADVDPLCQSLIEPHGDHSAQGVPVTVQEFLDRLLLTFSDIH